MMNDTKKGIVASLDELLQCRFMAKRLLLFKQRQVYSQQAAQKLSSVRGRGMEFSEVRAYQPGDDVRSINWQMTARMGKPYTKVYQEERERPVYFIVDQSSSMQFGTRVAFKSVIAAKVASLLAWSVLQQGDQVGGIVFNQIQHSMTQPKRQRKTLLTFLQQLSDFTAEQEKKDVTEYTLLSACQQLQQKHLHGSLLVVVSDFMNTDKKTLQTLAALAEKNKVLVIFVFDPLEKNVPRAGLYPVSNGEQRLLVNTFDSQQNDKYRDIFQQRFDLLQQYCYRYGMSFIPVATDSDLVGTLNQAGGCA